MKNKTACLTFFAILISFMVLGQKQGTNTSAHTLSAASDTRVNLQRQIALEHDSNSKEIMLNIDEGVEKFGLVINSSVTTGNLKIEVYDPKGDNQGTFSVGAQLNGGSERVSGNINKSLAAPQSGEWKVIIIPTEATGAVTIETAILY